MGESSACSTATTTRGSRRRVVLLRRRGGELDYDGPARICYCGLVAPLCTSWTDVNPGRRFFGFQNYQNNQQGGGCNFFQWYDGEMGERCIVVINELLSHVDRLHDENLRLRRGYAEKELVEAVRVKLARLDADIKKCRRRLKIALWSLGFTWLFVFAFLCMK